MQSKNRGKPGTGAPGNREPKVVFTVKEGKKGRSKKTKRERAAPLSGKPNVPKRAVKKGIHAILTEERARRETGLLSNLDKRKAGG